MVVAARWMHRLRPPTRTRVREFRGPSGWPVAAGARQARLVAARASGGGRADSPAVGSISNEACYSAESHCAPGRWAGLLSSRRGVSLRAAAVAQIGLPATRTLEDPLALS